MKIFITVPLFFLSLSAFADFDIENSYIAYINKQINSNCGESQKILDTAAKEFKVSSIRPLWHSIQVPCTEGQKPILYMELILTPENTEELKLVENYLSAQNGKMIYGVKVVFEKFQISHGLQRFNARGLQGESDVDYRERVTYPDFNSMLEENSKLERTFRYEAVGGVINLVAELFNKPQEIVEKNWNQTNYRSLEVDIAVKTQSREFVSGIVSYRFGVHASRNWE